MADLIAKYIDRDIEASGLSGAVPGVYIRVRDGVVYFKPGTIEIAFDSPKGAFEVSEFLERIPGRQDSHFASVGKGHVQVSRRGGGVVVQVGDGTRFERCVFAPNVARAVAKQLKAAASKAEKQ